MVPQIVTKTTAVKAREKVKNFFMLIIEKLSQKTDKKNVIKEIIAEKEKGFATLKTKARSNTSDTPSKEFSRETKAAAFIRDALPGSPRCKICNGYLPSRINSIDHIKRKADGGLGTLDNAQLTHPYCNTTYKN
jgi:hypothetical protein